MHPLHPPRRLSERQAGRVCECGKVSHVQGVHGRAPDESGLQPRAHYGHDPVDQDYAEQPGVEGVVDGEEVHQGVHASFDGGYEKGEERRIA
eukprot:7946804-Heterocapsa_arctica.AAC.1